MTQGPETTDPHAPPDEAILVKTATGDLLPKGESPRASAPAQQLAALKGFVDSPKLRLGRRGSQVDLTVDLMIEIWHDELVSFLQSYLTALLVNAEHEILCNDPEQQRFHAAMYETVHRELILAASPALFFGWQPLVKQFDFRVPEHPDGEPVWTERIDPYILTGFKQVPLDAATPRWAEDGSFDGFDVTGDAPQTVGTTHALWLTIGKHRAFGDLLGWGRARSVYDAWWDKHLTLDQASIYGARGIDPIPYVEYPEGKSYDPTTGAEEHNEVIAMRIANAMRAGSALAIPSTVYTSDTQGGYGEQPGTQKKWRIGFLEHKVNPGPFLAMSDKHDKRICFGMLVPPQTVMESKSLGLGGPNTVEALSTIAEDTLMEDVATIDEHLNKYVFPVIARANFGTQAKPVTKRTTRLSGRAKANLLQVLNALISSKSAKAALFDMKKIMEQTGIPVASAADQKANAQVQTPPNPFGTGLPTTTPSVPQTPSAPSGAPTAPTFPASPVPPTNPSPGG